MATTTVRPKTTATPRQAPGKRRGTTSRPVWQERPSAATQGAKTGTIVVILLLVAFPLYSIALTSFSTQASINIAGGLVVWPHGLTLNAYKLIAQGGVVGRALIISLLVTAAGTALSMIVTILASYGLSRTGSFGHKTILWFMMITMFFNGGIIPLFLVVSALGGFDQYWALILPSAVSVFNIIVMRAFFMNIASDMIESARIDGANDWRILCRIVLPTSKAVTAVIALFYAVGYWNSWFNILLFMPSDSSKWPLQMVMYSYVTEGMSMPGSGTTNVGQYVGNQQIAPLSLQMAVVTLTVVPVLIVYPFVQKHFTKGVLLGAIKGLCPHPGDSRGRVSVNDVHQIADTTLEWSADQQTLRVEPWGPHALRVRVAIGPVRDDLPGALELPPKPGDARVTIEDGSARLSNGLITAELTDGAEHQQKMLTFSSAGSELVAEEPIHFWWPGPRSFTPDGHGYYRLEQKFRGYTGEKLYGLGQHTHGLLDQKGSVVDLVQRNGEVTIPFLLSSRGYGLLWNNPAVGRVELAANGTRWVADSARQIDYWITAGSPADILARYADVTGHAPVLPEWATGFWQSKLRYRTQDELMAVAREYRRRGLPLSVIVADYFHWTHLGDWKFDPAEWPDPAAMVSELAETGTRLMVSVWPSVSPLSENYPTLRERGLLIGSENGPLAQATWPDKGVAAPVDVAFYDATNPQARSFVWSRVRDNYLRPYGICTWWLDACEPEIRPGFHANLRLAAGPGQAVANLYPRENSRTFFEGMAQEGQQAVTFNRSAWAGSQRYGAVLWSGDIPATFASLRTQIRAGLNVALSGIPWWTTDIGGFHGGDPADEQYRELIVRWFQYGAFCPLFRLHGNREPTMPFGLDQTGGPNELWSYGSQAYSHLVQMLMLRERLRPYIAAAMRTAAETGLPPMRPLFVDFPADAGAWEVGDEYMFGPDLLVAPVAEYQARSRCVYLPAGAGWTNAWTGEAAAGGVAVTVEAPLAQIPLFLRDHATLPIRP